MFYDIEGMLARFAGAQHQQFPQMVQQVPPPPIILGPPPWAPGFEPVQLVGVEQQDFTGSGA